MNLIRTTSTAVVQRPIEDVFDFVTSPANPAFELISLTSPPNSTTIFRGQLPTMSFDLAPLGEGTRIIQRLQEPIPALAMLPLLPVMWLATKLGELSA